MTDLTETLKRIRERHDDLCLMYGDGAPWDESCVEDGEQAHTDRGVLLDELERVTGEHFEAIGEIANALSKVTSLERELAEAKAGLVFKDTTNARLQECVEGEERARGYLVRVLEIAAPQLEPMNKLMHVCTQVDSVIASLRNDVAQAKAQMRTPHE